MSGMSMCRLVWVGGRGTCRLPAGGIRASQGTFSSVTYVNLSLKFVKVIKGSLSFNPTAHFHMLTLP